MQTGIHEMLLQHLDSSVWRIETPRLLSFPRIIAAAILLRTFSNVVDSPLSTVAASTFATSTFAATRTLDHLSDVLVDHVVV
jgi:hypothetical protein